VLVGLGIDVCRIERIARALSRHGSRFAERILATPELQDFERLSPAQRPSFLAKRFAAKEAFSKALGTGIGVGFGFTDLWIAHDTAGAPVIEVSLRLEGQLQARGVCRRWLSLTDETDLAAAVCVLEAQ